MKDPIVEEIRKVRNEHAASLNFDLKAICADLREKETDCGHPVVSLSPKQYLRPTGSEPKQDLNSSLVAIQSFAIARTMTHTQKHTWQVEIAKEEDFDSWMNLVDRVKQNFPGLETDKGVEEYKATVLKNIRRETALCAKQDGSLVGLLIFSAKQKRLGCMVVDPDFRRRGIGEGLVNAMLSYFKEGDVIWVSTFRENDDKGVAPRAMYKKIGFRADKLCVEFDYPHQMFRLEI